MNPRLRRCLGLLAVAAVLAGCGLGGTGRLRQTVNSTKTSNQSTIEHGTLVDVAAERDLSEDWELRVSDRSQRRAGFTKTNGNEERTIITSHQPSVDLVHTSSLWDADFSVDRRSQSTSGAIPDNLITNDRLYGRIVYHAFGLPTLSFQSEYTDREDDRTLDMTNLRNIFRVQHNLDDVSFFYEHLDEETHDYEFDELRERTDNLLRVTGSYLDEEGVLGATLNLSHSDFDLTERGPSTGPNVLTVQAGLFGIDPTPTVGALTQNPLLVDGDTSTGAGVQIGGVAFGGGIDRNIGLDQGPIPRQVLSLHLYTDNPFTAIEAAQFGWALYASNDNLSWGLLASSAMFVYDAGRQRFEITVGGAAPRYLKVVNLSHAPGAPSIQVTEIQALGPSGPAVNPTQERQNRADATVLLRPHDTLEIVLEGGAGNLARKSGSTLLQDENSYRYSLGTTYQPLDWLSTTVKASADHTDDPILISRDMTAYSGSVGVEPNEHLAFDFSASRTEEERDSQPYLVTDAIFARSSALLDHDVSISLQASQSQTEEPGAGRSSDRDFLLASLHAPLRQDLELRLDQQVDRLEVQEIGVGNTRTDALMSGVELTYRPTPLFTLFADLEYWFRAVERTGLTQRYQIDWLPFPEGQLFVQLDYRREQGGVVRGESESAFLQLRWKLERSTYLDLTSTWSTRGTGSGSTERVRSILLTLSLEF